MCRMVGVVFRDRFPLGALTDLRHVAEVGRIPGEEQPGHRDGWGIASFRNGSPRYIGRSARPAFLDPSYDSALEDVQEVDGPNILIAHVRAASAGGATLPNTHPFVVDGIVLGHNGTVKDFNPETKRKPRGETDSERLAIVLAERYEANGDLRVALKSLILEDIAEHDFTATVLLASDGKTLFGYRDFARKDRAGYYALKIAKCDDYVALFQETFQGYKAEVADVKKGQLVSVGLGLSIKKEMLP